MRAPLKASSNSLPPEDKSVHLGEEAGEKQGKSFKSVQITSVHLGWAAQKTSLASMANSTGGVVLGDGAPLLLEWTSLMDGDAWYRAAPVVASIFSAAVLIDFGALAKMMFVKRAYLWFNWAMSLLFLGSFLQILSASYENMDELWTQRSTLLILFMSLGYLLVFFAAVSVHDRFQSAMGAKRASACSNTSLIFGIVFACASVFWRILPSAASFDPLTALGLSPTAYASVGWVFSLLLGMLLLRSWSKADDQSDPSVPRKGRAFRAVSFSLCVMCE